MKDTLKNETSFWQTCKNCKGRGKKSQRLRKKVKLGYLYELEKFNKSDQTGTKPKPPKRNLIPCKACNATGLVAANTSPIPDSENYPHIAIIGGGIGGVALAVACLHRGIPFTLYEKDNSFNERSQGYGLTLQQASNAMASLGISKLKDGVISTRHVVHKTDGEIVGEWGMRKWLDTDSKTEPRRTNVHIARQALRLELLQQLEHSNNIKWGHRLVRFNENKNAQATLEFNVDGKTITSQADLIVGADGIRSSVRQILIGDTHTPLRYLGCIVILGICPLDSLSHPRSTLLDSATVFQTANGHERLYVMPFDKNSIMWQLSFPISEKEAIELSQNGPKSLKKEAIKRTQWHDPIPEIILKTQASLISGYPVYDRELLQPDALQKGKQVTLIGDAAHPMSPFKGQGANQALLDALSLANLLHIGCHPNSNWKTIGVRNSVLNTFETEMLKRSATKVKDSAEAAKFLHSDVVLHKGNEPRGRCLKKDI
ncbi:FAD-dependent oxidoreductase [Bizionia sp. KMM 8389]